MRLTITSDGRILNDGQPILLRGGHCHLFSQVQGDRSVDRNGAPFFVTFPADDNGCAGSRPETGLSVQHWGPNPTLFLDRLRASDCNLARVFLSNGVEFESIAPENLATRHPFARQGGKWRVAAAIRDNAAGAWSQPYFDALRAFVEAADQRGAAVQLCLFSYHDFTVTAKDAPFQYWSASFWNAANADDPAWAATHLVPISAGTNPSLLNRYFMDTTKSALMAAQRAYVEKVLAAVARRGNVILEIINEPRVALADGQLYMATWLDLVTRWIADWLTRTGASPRPLISANASYPQNAVVPPSPAETPRSDVDAWAENSASLKGYAELDLVSYHGLTGVADAGSPCGPAPQTDLGAVRARIARHRALHLSKALMMSTDAVRVGTQTFGANVPRIALERRDGQVRTGVGYGAALGPQQQRARFDLDNWAYNVCQEGLAPGEAGRIHFQNHSTFERSFEAIGAAYAAAAGQSTVAWQDPLPPRVTGGANHQNFWWSHHQTAASGELVNQLHTENAPTSAAAATGESEIGWRHNLRAVGGLARLSAPYELRSVSEIEDPQATVEQTLRFSIATATQPAEPLATDERVVQRGQQGPGRLALEVTLVANQIYLVTVSSRVVVRYQNRTKVGYGETIVRFLGLA